MQLSYLPVLVKDKPILFIAWEIKNAYCVKFIPLRRRYYTKKNAVLISTPNHLHQVTLKVSNIWRKTTINLSIHAIQLDEAAMAQLINAFHPLNKTKVNAPLAAHINNQLFIKPLTIHQYNSAIKQVDPFNVTIQSFTINIQPIHYQ